MVVALSGYYGFGNAGDEAILLALVREARRRGVEPVVLSANPAATEQMHEVAAVPRTRPGAVVRLLRRSEGLLSGGGGLLQNRTSNRSLAYYLGLLYLAQAMRRTTWVFGQSLGPLSPGALRWTAPALRRSREVVVRDAASQELARSLGVEARLGADAALLLEPPGVAREERLVVLVPRGRLPDEANLRLREAGERLQAHGYEVLVLGLQPRHDEAALELFRGFTRELSGDPRRVLYWIAQAGYVLSLRLHGLILAAAAGTPYAGGSYDPKVAAFCRESGAPYWELPGDPAVMVQLALHRLGPNKSALRDLRVRAAEGFNWVWGRPR
ncbi:MAG TPA: polysaccharide pyruvyl transferase CsaB [Oceanithermus profundus]|uniref:Polysaccharide pyruvyl transferase CsaB n=1 Tax=Oceanithermus profundus TaxID=187137 RepID=A0A7C4ZFJ6_9DEIN|nr:polysaccharide pyruvyl transferase CsaB [Oceanithermus profundus]